MSRIAKYPVAIPAGVSVNLSGNVISVKGPLGTLLQTIPQSVSIESANDEVICRAINGADNGNALSGTMRALINNMVLGVSKGFERKLTLVGVGYRAQAQGNKVNLTLGFSHPVVHEMPEGVKVETPTQTEIVLKGPNKQSVGQVAADIRAYRPPEPYKGKGVRYSDEVVVIKETKKK